MDYFKQLMGIAVIVCPVAIALASICIKKPLKNHKITEINQSLNIGETL